MSTCGAGIKQGCRRHGERGDRNEEEGISRTKGVLVCNEIGRTVGPICVYIRVRAVRFLGNYKLRFQ